MRSVLPICERQRLLSGTDFAGITRPPRSSSSAIITAVAASIAHSAICSAPAIS